MKKIIIFARYGAWEDNKLTKEGMEGSEVLAKLIEGKINGNMPILWSSCSNSALETSAILKRELAIKDCVEFEELGTNGPAFDYNPLWLKSRIKEWEKTNGEDLLIVVTHKEFVDKFPQEWGIPLLHLENGEAVLREGNTYTLLKQK